MGTSVASDDPFMTLPNKIQMMGIESHSKVVNPTRPNLPQPQKRPGYCNFNPNSSEHTKEEN